MTNREEKINSIQYIEETIQVKNIRKLVFDQQEKLINSVKIGFKTFLNSKKWLIYLVLAFMWIPVIIINEDFDLQIQKPDEAFVNAMLDGLFPTIFIFGCLLLSLPLSADEISDHSIELYLVRPIKREIYWLSRWIVVNIVVYCVNIIIYFIYYLFVHAFAEQGMFVGIAENLIVFGKVAIILLLATLIYSGSFLLVGMIGNRGLLLSFMLAIFELFLIQFFFLDKNPYIPQNNIYEIANDLLPNHVDFDTPDDLTLLNAWIYVTIFPIVVFFGGAFYLRMREIE
jgi:ABC-type transport system involved in multi-copper enzyme maturation permease subunit